MANKPKAKGTARETKLSREADARPGLRARRAENNAPGRDVDVTLAGRLLIPHEVKDRQQLNAHKVLAHSAEHQPGLLSTLVWHRTSKPDGAKKASPDGPTAAVLPWDSWLDVLEVVAAAARTVDLGAAPAELVLALDTFEERYPQAACL